MYFDHIYPFLNTSEIWPDSRLPYPASTVTTWLNTLSPIYAVHLIPECRGHTRARVTLQCVGGGVSVGVGVGRRMGVSGCVGVSVRSV